MTCYVILCCKRWHPIVYNYNISLTVSKYNTDFNKRNNLAGCSQFQLRSVHECQKMFSTARL